MSAILGSLIASAWPYILAGIGVLLGLWKAYSAGQKSAEAKQAERDKAALENRLEMDREATDIERKVTGMTDDEARKEAMKWAKPR